VDAQRLEKFILVGSLTTTVNPLTNTEQSFLNDPYPTLAWLRAEAPVWWSKKENYWLVSKYEDVKTVLRDQSYERQVQRWKHAPNPILISLLPHLKALSNVSNNWLMNLNPPAHTRVRSFVNKAFTPSMVQSLRPKIEMIADGLLEQIGGDRFDLVLDYAFPLPVAVIALMLGIPMTETKELRHWSTRLTAAAGRRSVKLLMDAGQAVEEIHKFLKPIIEKKRLHPEDDLLSTLVQLEEDGKRLSSEELIANCILLLVAGHETTSGLIANTVLNLLRHQDQWQMLREHRNLINSAIEEGLRFESPVQAAPRLASKDGQLNGQTIKAGQLLWVMLGSANRDESQFENANSFEINRLKNNHLAFAEGIHRCVGASLADVEAEIAISKLIEKFPSLSIAADPVNFRAPFIMRSPKELWLVRL
jgi:cytochrome P450